MSLEPGDAPAQHSAPPPDMVVAVGASAGGVAALKQFFAQVPRDTRAAFVVVLHLSPDHESHLSQVLQTATSLSVDRVADRTRLAAGHVYVISPNSSLTIADGDVILSAVKTPEQRRAPVDVLFRTLAEAQGSNAVGVVLSGTGPNGSSGIKWIKEHGGLVLVQDPAEAEFADMPRNALATGLVDYALPAAAISDTITRYFARRAAPRLSASADGEDAEGLRDLVALLRVRTGHDFSNYKQGTVLRRVARRMHVHGVSTVRDYARFLRDSPEEAGLLLNELLISVTSFFRDAQPYEVLEQRVVPQLFAGKQSSDQVRVWVAGCATGEEAYSVAMLLAEAAATIAAPPAIQVFGSDLDERAISIAREGVYTEAEVGDLSEERLRRFFVRDQTRHRVRRDLREMVLFAHHDILKDPPFSHLDLVVCRNVLIYLNRPMQQRLIETFHFALRPSGYLFLGGSETADAASDLFAPFDKAARIYESRTAAIRLPALMTEAPLAPPRVETRFPEIRPTERQSPADLHHRLLEQYAPPSIVVTEEHQVIHISESAARYLAVPAGEPSRDLLRLLRPELRVDVRTALHQAVRDRASVEVRDIPLRADGGRVSIGVRPVLREGDPPRGFLLVMIEAATGTEQASEPPLHLMSPTEAPVSQLEEELERVKQHLSATVEQYESQVEEAKASNEELQAMNEELRSATEELETSKEELQSVNEELTTVNQELKTKIDELATTNNDFQNYINSTDIGTIFVDRALCVKLFTPRACDVFHLVESDIGRPLAHIANTLAYDQLKKDISAVMDRLQTIEREIQGANARWYLMRLLPYRTSDDRIDGIVLTFLDITNRVTTESHVRTSEERLRLLIDSATDYAIFAMTQNGDVAFWNAGAERMFGYAAADIVGRHASLIFTPEDRAAGALDRELERARLDGRSVSERVYVRKNGTLLFSSSETTRLGDHAALGFVTIARDLSAQRDAADALARATAGMEERVAQRTQDLQQEVTRRTIAHEHVTDLMHRLITTREEERARIARGLHEQLGGQLTTLRLMLEQLRRRSTAPQPDDDGLNEALELTEALGSGMDLLAWELRPTLLDDLGLAAALPRFVRDWSAHYGIPVEVRATAAITGQVSRDVEVTFYRIALEALNNIALHAHATRADVRLEVRDGSLELIVKDDGIGFEPRATDRAQGIGLLGMRERASLVGATLDVESAPGGGTRVSLRYPISATAEPATRGS